MRMKVLSTILVCLLLSLAATAQVVDEARSKVVIDKTNAIFDLSIAQISTPATATLHLQIVDTEDKVRVEKLESIGLRTGKRSYPVAVAVGDLLKAKGDDLAWMRLRYRIGSNVGIISFTELMKDVFDLRVSAPSQVVPGSEYRLRVLATNPFTKTAVNKVAVEGKVTLDLDTDDGQDELELRASATTDSKGLAILKFKVPTRIRLDYEPELDITGRRNGFVRKLEDDLDNDFYEKTTVFISTDKPIYQPGETFNLRGLFLDSNNTVIAGEKFEIKIEDEEDEEVFSQTVETSQYGIANVSWKIPADIKLGKHEVKVDDNEKLTFKVARYDVPNFVVTSEVERTFYLHADRTAKVTVGANYLFGKPVTNGRVRIVRETERRWNFKKQRDDVTEIKTIEGATDLNGKYLGSVDLSDAWNELNSSEWERFKDVTFTAYFTDTSTNRTEHKRFDIRISKEPIHIYFIYNGSQHPGLPMLTYVSTFYADGTPAECSVDVTVRGRTVSSFRTNSKGAAKLKFSIPEDSLETRKVNLRISARDGGGKRGTFDEIIHLTENENAVQFETDKAIYAVGDPILLKLQAAADREMVYIDLVKDSVVVESLAVNVEGGKGWIRIPYRDRFTGEVEIVAYTDVVRRYSQPGARFGQGVFFPGQGTMLVDAKFDRRTYRPGDIGKLRFAVLDGANRPSESALGITIFDKALEERSRTEGEYSSYFGGFSRLLGLDRSFGGVTFSDLNNIDTSRPVSDEVQLAAEIILAGSPHNIEIFHSEYHPDDARQAFADQFESQKKPIEKVLRERFDADQTYPRDLPSLTGILRQGGVEFQGVADPWGRTYAANFETDRSHLIMQLSSSGPDKKAGTPDDFVVMTSRFRYFQKTASEIEAAVNQEFVATGAVIRDDATFRRVIKKHGIDTARLIDAWGRPYRLSFETRGRTSVIHLSSLGPDGVQAANRWGGDDFDVTNIHTDYFLPIERRVFEILGREVVAFKRFPGTVDEFKASLRANGLDLDSLRDGAGSQLYAELQPSTTRETDPAFELRGMGPNAADSTDDVLLGSFSKTAVERYHLIDRKGTAEIKTLDTSNAKGAILGVILDMTGAVIPGIEVVAIEASDPQTRFVSVSDDEGKFFLGNLPSGNYSLTAVGSGGFRTYREDGIIVRSQRLFEMRITLDVGNITATVTVISATEVDQAHNATGMNVTSKRARANISFPLADQASTPRLREYFPETLLWQPQLITDVRGRAELNFKMADNITTWKMYAIASTKDGKVAVADKEVTSFQPFFIDLDPPKFLTEGDRISLPVQVRNYTGQRQVVAVLMEKGAWFSLAGPELQNVNVEPGRSQNAVFTFRADAPVKGGTQRITAAAGNEADAIEKPVTVRPNGREIVETQSSLFTHSETLRIDLPLNALPGTGRADIKIYPNLVAHVGESVEGLLKRPYGCGEQTTSSTYPNLMILKFAKTEGPLRAKALEYLREGYKRLIGYQVADGGFSYWGRNDSSNLALTAYVLRFLNDAKEFVDVEEGVVRRAEEYLAKSQQADGSWPAGSSYGDDETSRKTKTTAYVARSIAMRKSAVRNASLQKALDYLESQRSVTSDPYTLALFGLAVVDSGDIARANNIADQLRSVAVREGRRLYWDQKTPTLFYGWGEPARIEATALGAQLLARSPGGTDLSSQALLYLLSKKDLHGVWYSTQTTVNVLDAFLAIGATDTESSAQSVTLLLNGEVLQTLSIDPANFSPIAVDVPAAKLAVRPNTLEVRTVGRSPLMVSVVATHYIPWEDAITRSQHGLKFDYRCDKTTAAIMDEITCTVEAGETTARGGMLLAEIGLPPGADVKRESLDRVIDRESGISRYDILPDRIVVYFWSRPSGTRFNFSFRPRYGIDAQTPPSVVYDYYNPESQAFVRPLKFSVK